MTVEDQVQIPVMEEVVVSDKAVEEPLKSENVAEPVKVEKSSSFKEESNFLSDLKDHEKKALNELKSKLEEAITENTLFKKEETKEKAKSPIKNAETEKEKSEPAKEQDEVPIVEESEEKEAEIVDKEISLWGVPLLPSKGSESTDVLLLKFLRAREFKTNEAFQMLKKTLQWRKEFKADSLINEELGSDLPPIAYMSGKDLEGHPICYNVFGALESEELYQKAFGTEEKRDNFLRWRFQLMEKGIQELDFKPEGINSLLQINDLKNSPGPSKKELRFATKQAVHLLQDNYPEFVARNIFINVPFWYYAFNALFSPFLTQRTKSKMVVARPGRTTETLLKFIPIEEIPVEYGGFKRDKNDSKLWVEDNNGVKELIVKGGSIETIEIAAPEIGTTFEWDLTVLGWEVNYKEEFVPSDEGSYSIIIQKVKKLGLNEGPIRNTFCNNELGKIVLTVDNSGSKKKKIKKVLYRHKTKNAAE
ncbi:patellin-4-like [Impatiens glandulifera]|uniref:patellin-4-like n=1 Tax=Impatiens glandulifera TaxID=253017 RepID=UPI001FB13277|nr:patellin-4-like [Impatiens glandulifera]